MSAETMLVGSEDGEAEVPVFARDEVLVSRIRREDKTALDELVEAYLAITYKRVCSLVPREDAEDVTQDIFLNLVRSINDFQGKSAFATWFNKIVANRVADYYRKKFRRGGIDILLKSDEDIEKFGEFFDPYSAVDAEITVKNILDILPDRYRKVLQLKFFEGLSFGKIAEVLGKEYEAARSCCRRAEDAFAEKLKSYETGN